MKLYVLDDSFARMAPPARVIRELKPAPYIPKSTGLEKSEKNYGVDISTLIRMIENGEPRTRFNHENRIAFKSKESND